jgi:hypothetical protein
MGAFTPGPWRYEQTPLPQVWSESVIEGGSNLEKRRIHIADVRGWGALQYREDGAAMQDANGLLIAAAPELLEAGQALYEVIGNIIGPQGVRLADELEKAGTAWIAAQKKAEGCGAS